MRFEVDAENITKRVGGDGFDGAFAAGEQLDIRGLLDEFEVIHFSEEKQEFGLVIETRADSVEGGGDMFAHVGPIRTGAAELDFLWLWEKSTGRTGDDFHDVL